MLKILRLMCLQSICCNGFGKKYDEFRREILQTYGYEYVFTLDNLEKLGLLRKSNSIYDFSKVRNAFGLYVENPNVEVPNDLSYVSGVFSVFSVFSVFFCVFLCASVFSVFSICFWSQSLPNDLDLQSTG